MTTPLSDPRDPLAMAAVDGPDEMGRELSEGPEAVTGTLAAVSDVSATVASMAARADRIVLVGTGASLAMCEIAASIWRSRLPGGKNLVVRQSTEAALGDLDGLKFTEGDLVLTVSQSGRSPETLAAARQGRLAGSQVVAVTAGLDTPLATNATQVVPIASGQEDGAATKSALATLAALLAVSGAIGTDPASAERMRRRLDEVAESWAEVIAPGGALAHARHAWILGFASALGIAQAGALLWHEKVRRPASAATPSEFRHGLVEAAQEEDAVLLISLGSRATSTEGYLERLRSEIGTMGLTLVELEIGRAGEDDEAIQALAALLRVQQLARATALAGGTYRDGFAVLRQVVTAADDLFA
jgi:glutamine---fructose-6-phosphate transaminase (isomerizing)